MEYVAFAGLAFGYAAAVICSYRSAMYLIRVVHRKSLQTNRRARFIWPLGIVGAIAAFVPGFFLATFVGGTFGGGYGEVVSTSMGIGRSGIFVGLATGIFVVFTLTVCVGAACGSLVGLLLNRRACRCTST